MQLEVKIIRTLVCSLCFLAVAACSFNPFTTSNHTTGSAGAAAVGAGVGAGGVWLLGGSKTLMLAGGLAGGAVGYYITTLRYEAGGIISAGGNVYVLGEYIGIYLPTDKVFDVNTAELLPGASNILDSVVTVLQRNPNNNIMISGNTSGFGSPRREMQLSRKRARVVAAYLWSTGITQFKDKSNETRRLTYTGYGDFFPIASDLTNKGIRTNSRIQITSYPSKEELHDNGHKINPNNIASMNDDAAKKTMDGCGRDESEC